MDFIQPLLLLGSAAIAAPIILHLLFRPQPRVVELGTLRFLHELLRQHARRQRIKHWALLLVRCFALVVLAVLFARPLVHDLHSSAASGRLVVLIDASASMARDSAGEALWKRALSEAERLLREAPQEQETVVAFFDQEVHALRQDGPSAPTLAASEAMVQLQELAKRGPGQGGTNYLAAMQWALEQCPGDAGSRRDRICLITDLQRVPAGSIDAWPKQIDVEIIDLAPAAADASNLSIGEAVPAKHVLRPGEESNLLVDLRGKEDPAASPIRLRIDLRSGDQQRQIDRELTRGDEAQPVNLPGLDPGVWHGQVTIEHADAADFDDVRHFALLVEPRLDVLLVDFSEKAGVPASDAYFLEAAVRLAPGGQDYDLGPFRLTTASAVRPDVLAHLDRQQIAILTDVVALDDAWTTKLVEFVQQGGGLLLFLGLDASTSATSKSLDSQLGINELHVREAVAGAPFRIQTWDDRHPIFAPFRDAELGALELVAFDRITTLKPSADWRTLATFDASEPAILERALGKGRILAVAGGCGARSGSWPRSASYLPLIHQLLRYLVGRADQQPIQYVAADFMRPAGVSDVEGRCVVANVASSESNLRSWTPLEFRQTFALPLPAEQPAQSAATMASQWSPDRQRPNEWWPWLAVALLGLLMLDTILANRVRF